MLQRGSKDASADLPLTPPILHRPKLTVGIGVESYGTENRLKNILAQERNFSLPIALKNMYQSGDTLSTYSN